MSLAYTYSKVSDINARFNNCKRKIFVRMKNTQI